MFQGEHSCQRLFVDQSEAEIMDVPVLLCESGAPVNSSIRQDNVPFIYTQTPNDYYNQCLTKNTAPHVTFPTVTSDSSQSELPPSSFTGVFPNLSYNLILQTRDQHLNPDPELQQETEKNSNGYQAQSLTDTLSINHTEDNSESSLSCISTYIFLPPK